MNGEGAMSESKWLPAMRCMEVSAECGQCELKRGHKGKHLAGYLMWEAASPVDQPADVRPGLIMAINICLQAWNHKGDSGALGVALDLQKRLRDGEQVFEAALAAQSASQIGGSHCICDLVAGVHCPERVPWQVARRCGERERSIGKQCRLPASHGLETVDNHRR